MALGERSDALPGLSPGGEGMLARKQQCAAGCCSRVLLPAQAEADTVKFRCSRPEECLAGGEHLEQTA